MAYKMIDYYAVLEVEPAATTKEIHKAYRKLAQKWHPDVCQEKNAAEMFQKIVTAYEILSNEEEREFYDRHLKMEREGKGLHFEDVFNSFHSHQKGAVCPIQGAHVEMNATFKAAEARQQMEKQITFDRYINCEKCEGFGHLRKSIDLCTICRGVGHTLVDKQTPFGDIKAEEACSHCDAKGYVNPEECADCKGNGKKIVLVTLKFTLPKETTEGFRLKFRGKGDAGMNGGKNGDLILTFIQAENDDYRILYGYDLTTKVDVPFKTALKGGNVSVKLPNGETIKVPLNRGIQSGHQIIIEEAGLFDPKKERYGNLTAIVNVTVPTKLSEEQTSQILGILK